MGGRSSQFETHCSGRIILSMQELSDGETAILTNDEGWPATGVVLASRRNLRAFGSAANGTDVDASAIWIC